MSSLLVSCLSFPICSILFSILLSSFERNVTGPGFLSFWETRFQPGKVDDNFVIVHFVSQAQARISFEAESRNTMAGGAVVEEREAEAETAT